MIIIAGKPRRATTGHLVDLLQPRGERVGIGIVKSTRGKGEEVAVIIECDFAQLEQATVCHFGAMRASLRAMPCPSMTAWTRTFGSGIVYVSDQARNGIPIA